MIVKSKNCLNPETGQAGITRILRIFEIFSIALIRLIIKYLFYHLKFIFGFVIKQKLGLRVMDCGIMKKINLSSRP